MRGTAAAFAVAGAGVVPMGATASEGDGFETETIRSRDGIVAASQPVAAEVGAEVLDAGGNAFDAAAAVQLALTVVDPYGSGIGGSGMMVGYSAADGRTYSLNSQVRAPIDASVDIRFDEGGERKPNNELQFGGVSVGTPGTLRGLDVMLKQWGTMDLSELAGRPAEIAEEGFEVDERLASVVAGVAWRFNEAAQEIWGVDGDPVQAGETVVQEDLGKTLRLIEDEGIRPFYRGEIAEAIVDTVQDDGGVMRLEDLKSYRPTLDRPTGIRYDNPHPRIANNEPVDVVSAPAPIEGGYIVPGMLKLLDGLDVSGVDSLSAERFNLTWQARAAMEDPVITTSADPEFVDVPSTGILDDEFLDGRRDLMEPGSPDPGLLDAESDPWAYQAGEPWTTDPPVGVEESDVPDEHEPPEQDTTHFTVADGDGNVVSFTGTLSSGFGAGTMVPGYGFFLNNSVAQLADGGRLAIGPLRRYTTTVAPTIVLRGGKPLFTCGSPGGIIISQAVADVLVNVLEYGMSVEDAVAHPRMYVFTGEWEPGTPEETIDGLEDLGYEMNAAPGGGVGDTQMIAVDQERDELVGVYDPRRGGGVSSVDDGIGRSPRR